MRDDEGLKEMRDMGEDGIPRGIVDAGNRAEIENGKLE
jgi:hypothetical protein